MANLPPIDLSEEVKKFDAFEEKKEVQFQGCKHKQTLLENQQLKCQSCPAVWTGTRLHELQKLLQVDSVV